MYTEEDAVHYVLWQADHYGINLTRKDTAMLANCSINKAREYDTYERDEYGNYDRPMHPNLKEYLLQKFPFPNRQIKTLEDDCNDVLYYVTETGRLYTKKKEPAKPVEIDNVSQFNINLPVSKFQNYSFIYPSQSGLYMLAQIVCIPYDIKERHFLIKVGMSKTNLDNRIKSYKGSNPLAVCIDYKLILPSKVEEAEKKWHQELGEYYIRLNNSEWFDVPFNDYVSFLENGFNKKFNLQNSRDRRFNNFQTVDYIIK